MQTKTYASVLAAIAFAAAGVVVVTSSTPATAQTTSKFAIPQSESVTLQAKITAIDTSTRAVTLQSRAGSPVTLTAGPAIRLEMLKVGDTVDAKYYRSVAFMVTPPRGGGGVASAPSEDEIAQMVAQPAQAPGGVGVRLTRVSGTVVGINLAAHSIDIVDPSGGRVYTLDVTDPSRIAMLPQLNVGDTITAVISQALAVSIEPARRSWF